MNPNNTGQNLGNGYSVEQERFEITTLEYPQELSGIPGAPPVEVWNGYSNDQKLDLLMRFRAQGAFWVDKYVSKAVPEAPSVAIAADSSPSTSHSNAPTIEQLPQHENVAPVVHDEFNTYNPNDNIEVRPAEVLIEQSRQEPRPEMVKVGEHEHDLRPKPELSAEEKTRIAAEQGQNLAPGGVNLNKVFFGYGVSPTIASNAQQIASSGPVDDGKTWVATLFGKLKAAMG